MPTIKIPQFKYIGIKQMATTRGESYYSICNKTNGAVLGYVFYYQPWKRHAFTQEKDIVLDAGGLEEISQLLKHLD